MEKMINSRQNYSCYIDILESICNILTSDLAELSNMKYTCVNNRCIRSKISGDNLGRERVELSADATLTEAGIGQTII